MTASNAVTITVVDPAGRVNVASAANGSTIVSSSNFAQYYGPEGAIDGDRKGQGWGNTAAGMTPRPTTC